MSKSEYEKALKKSSYKNVRLIYTDKKDIKQKRNRLVNPSFSKNVSTSVAKRFSNLIGQHFAKSKNFT